MELEISSPKTTVSIASAEVSESSGNHTTPPLQLPPLKRKRNLPGMPDPNAEVIALSPKTLMATNRFVCEICNKGFQRDQNLQLHRRGHNLPWKLKQRTGNEVRKKVYLCPEPSCVHHDPSRALGDLTGIKKHYCRKHGEKKYKCERCSKKYAVQADWKAHMKTCGSREYKCDCGTLFSRRDSFITHRAFCEALAEESTRAQKMVARSIATDEKNQSLNMVASSPPPPPPLTPSATAISPVLSIHSPELPENPTAVSLQTAATTCSTTVTTTVQSSSSFSNVSCSTSVFASIFAPSTVSAISHPSQTSSTSFSHLLSTISPSERQTHTIQSSSTMEPTSLCLSSPSLYLSSNEFSLFPTTEQDHRHFAPLSLQPAMSATALLQKAAQMGATASNGSFLRGLGLSISSSAPGEPDTTTTSHSQWSSHVKLESNSATTGHGLGLPAGGTACLTDFMMGPSSLYGTKPATLDFLGLGIGPSNPSTGGLSALLTSFGDDLDLPASIGEGNSTEEAWEIQPHRKANGSALL